MEQAERTSRGVAPSEGTVVNRSASGSAIVLEKPIGDSTERITQRDATHLSSLKRENESDSTNRLSNVTKSVDRALNSAPQKTGERQFAGIERANFENLRATNEINNAIAEVLKEFNDKHKAFAPENLAKGQADAKAMEGIKDKIRKSSASEEEKKEAIATLDKLDQEYKRLCDGVEAKGKELGLRVNYLPIEGFKNLLNQIPRNDLSNMSFEELIQKYPGVMSGIEERFKSMQEEFEKVRREKEGITLEEAKRDPSLREAYAKQTLEKVLSKKKYAHLRDLRGKVGYAERAPGPGGEKAGAFTMPGSGDIYLTREGIEAARNQTAVEGFMVHELRHRKRIQEGHDSFTGTPAGEAEAYQDQIDFLKEEGGYQQDIAIAERYRSTGGQ